MTDRSTSTARHCAAQALADKFAKVEPKLDAAAAKRKKKRRKFTGSRMLLRFYQFQRACRVHYGRTFPKDDDGALDDLGILASCAMAAGLAAAKIVMDAAPWLVEVDWFLDNVDRSVAFLEADAFADRVGWIDYALHQHLDLRTLGATDVRKAEREELTKQRKAAERKAKRSAEKAKPKQLTKRETTIIKLADRYGFMADVVAKAGKSAAFRGLKNVRSEVHRVCERLKKAGIIGMRLERCRGERRQKEFYLWLIETKEVAVPQALPIDATPKVPGFIGVFGVADSCPRVSEGDSIDTVDVFDAMSEDEREALYDAPFSVVMDLMRRTAPVLAGAPPGAPNHRFQKEGIST